MRLVGKPILVKFREKNKGNSKLRLSIEKLINDIEKADWKTPLEIKASRPDADRIHSEGFYFFNLEIHRSMILIELDEQEASVVWIGSHADYERTFQNNKKVIQNWLRSKGWIR